MSPLKCFCHLVLALGFAPVILYIDLERSDGTILGVHTSAFHFPENSRNQLPSQGHHRSQNIIPYIRYYLVSPTESASGISVMPGSLKKQRRL